jgi:hypothetical protein
MSAATFFQRHAAVDEVLGEGVSQSVRSHFHVGAAGQVRQHALDQTHLLQRRQLHRERFHVFQGHCAAVHLTFHSW